MNLHDLIRRRDRSVRVAGGEAVAVDHPTPAGRRRAVQLTPDTRLDLLGAHEFTVLRTLPRELGWSVKGDAGVSMRIALVDPEEREIELWHARLGSEPAVPVLDWPVPTPTRFTLRIELRGGGGVVLVGALFGPRRRLLPLLRGHGVEVGPGMRPAVESNTTRDVRYVEKFTAEQWAQIYAKRDISGEDHSLWDRYVVDSACELTQFAEDSLDFVFSSHVLEHLPNPRAVLRNWWRKLAPGGVVAGVVPDARYCFDLRQPLSTPEDFTAQERTGFVVTDAMYRRWCTYTSPENTVESLKARDYSVHVSFFTPWVFRQLVDSLLPDVAPDALAFESSPNNKDFGFLLRKSSR